MSTISTADARALFTKKLVAVYSERNTPTTFLRSFFREDLSDTKEVSIEVERGTELIAVDVERGTEGNRNSFSKSTEKIFVPPYYREYFDMTDLNFYDRLFTSTGTVDLNTFNRMMDKIADSFQKLQNKIDRSYEVQASQVFETGVVTLINGTNIDFKRKAASLIAYGAGHGWAIATVDPTVILESGCDFLRTKGKMSGGVVNAIVGSEALSSLLSNPLFVDKANLRRVSLVDVTGPRRDVTGAALHGEISVGSYTVRLWTYPQFYDTKAASHIPYVNPKKVVLVPESPNFVLAYAAVPQIMMANNETVVRGVQNQTGKYLLAEYIDERASAHIGDMKSAGIAVPVAVDQIFTAQVIAS
ncbi:major capsid protein [uncultured Winogradskyella sp.]|uniref:major capsid protein n=1 Tax=uncultured Winogradskyella sp. TaxID=395353 RepID=UPI0030EF8F78|tara:strand:+ start:1192 stop:2268 length:1077 start_codon:yes stop_codon:yes gene_type:complete